MISRAAPRLAPELIPKTKGPASGFLNKVCINKPLKDKLLPANMAVKAFGILYSQIIYSQDDVDTEPPKIADKVSSRGILTEPRLIFKTRLNTSNKPR